MGDKEILKEAIHKEEEIKNFLKAFNYVYSEQKLPNDWDINKFSSLLDKLSNSLKYTNDVNISKKMIRSVKDFVDKIPKQEQDINVSEKDIASKAKEIASSVLHPASSGAGAGIKTPTPSGKSSASGRNSPTGVTRL